MEIQLLGKEKVIMSNPYSKHNYFGWPSVTRLQNGKIAVGASGLRLAHICPFGKAVLSYSEDEGKTFSAPAPIIDTVLDDRDCGLCTFGEDGVIVTSFNNTVEMQHGWMKNAPWCCDLTKKEYINAYLDLVTQEEQNEALGSVFRISNDCGVTFGELHKSPVTSPHGPVELHDGTILWVGTVFNGKGIYAYKLNPEDGHMELVGEIPPAIYDGKEALSCEPHAIELDDGTIICHIRIHIQHAPLTICQSVSKDGGKSWSKPVQILEDNGGAPAHLMKHSSGALISVYGYREAPYGIRAAFSFDGGKSWDTDIIIYKQNVSGDIGYPATVELSDGSLLTVFYAHLEKDAPSVIMTQNWRFEK